MCYYSYESNKNTNLTHPSGRKLSLMSISLPSVILKSVYTNKIYEKAYGTRCSQAVPHPSTILARRCLTSVIRRERVCSSWYGRRRSTTKCNQSHHGITVIEQATSPTWCEPNFLDRSELMSTDKKYQTSYSH